MRPRHLQPPGSLSARCFIIAQGINIEKTGCLRADVEACPPCGSRTGQSAPVCNILQTGQQDRLSRRYAICDMTSEDCFKDNRSCSPRGTAGSPEQKCWIGAQELRSTLRGIISLFPPPALQGCIETSIRNNYLQKINSAGKIHHLYEQQDLSYIFCRMADKIVFRYLIFILI